MRHDELAHLGRTNLGVLFIQKFAFESKNPRDHSHSKASHHLQQEFFREDLVDRPIGRDLRDLAFTQVLQGVVDDVKLPTSGLLGGFEDLVEGYHIACNEGPSRPLVVGLDQLPHEFGHVLGVGERYLVIARSRDSSLGGRDVDVRNLCKHMGLTVRHAKVIHKVAVVHHCVFQAGVLV